MFDAGFEFALIQRNIIENNDHVCEFIFQFKTKGRKRYIVIVEEYLNNIFVPKFYPSTEKNNPNRFAILTNEYQSARVIRTIIDIMLFIYKISPEVSFGWLGVATLLQHKKEGKSFTQRYRINKNVMLNFFNADNCYHYDDYRTSTYLLINKKQKDIQQFLEDTVRMFTDLYPDLERFE